MVAGLGIGLAATGCDGPEDIARDPLAGVEGCEDVLDWTDEGSLLEGRALERIREERRKGGRCGDRVYPPQGPLDESPKLHCAARLHSVDMSVDNYVGFVAPDEVGVAARLASVGYEYATWAASIGAGWTEADNAVDSWLGDQDHCWKLFAAEIEEIGIGVVILPEIDPATLAPDEEPVPAHTTYWTLLVGTELD